MNAARVSAYQDVPVVEGLFVHPKGQALELSIMLEHANRDANITYNVLSCALTAHEEICDETNRITVKRTGSTTVNLLTLPFHFNKDHPLHRS